ncbi:MAG TPA: type III polyketide synthase [Gemmataceae bacterium]
MSMDILGLGTAAPELVATRQESAAAAPYFCKPDETQARLLPVLYRKAGVERRHLAIIDTATGGPFERQNFFAPARDADDRGPTTAQRMQRYERYAPELARRAAAAALADASLAPGEVTHLVTVSCSGFYAPGFDIALMRSLGLRPGVARTHVGFMGCHGAMNALRVAHAFTQADPSARVLLCALELCSLHFRYGWDPETVVTNALFSDGSAAAVCAPPRGAKPRWTLRESGSVLMPDSEDAMTWRVRDHGFEMTLSPRVPELIARHLRPWLGEWLAGRGVKLEEVGSWAVHPGGPRILQAVGETLGLPAEALKASREVLAEYGNMSSPTVLFVLQRLSREQAARPCVALGFGPGLVAEGMLLG